MEISKEEITQILQDKFDRTMESQLSPEKTDINDPYQVEQAFRNGFTIVFTSWGADKVDPKPIIYHALRSYPQYINHISKIWGMGEN